MLMMENDQATRAVGGGALISAHTYDTLRGSSRERLAFVASTTCTRRKLIAMYRRYGYY